MSTNTIDNPKRVTTATFRSLKAEGRKIVMITAYDYTQATMVDAAGVDAILIGDSASNVIMGNDTTLPITLDEMIFLARNVARGARRALVVCDMPFGSYQGDPQTALRSAIRILKETGCAAVKLEGGREIAEQIRLMVGAGIPVMGHLGLTPQSVNQFGGYGVRAREEAEAQRLIDNARLLQELGCFSIVLEKIPAALATRVSQSLDIPTIGIGAGAGTDGQVLVYQDMLGMNRGFQPKFLRRYASLADTIEDAVGRYAADVRSGAFPSSAEQY